MLGLGVGSWVSREEGGGEISFEPSAFAPLMPSVRARDACSRSHSRISSQRNFAKTRFQSLPVAVDCSVALLVRTAYSSEQGPAGVVRGNQQRVLRKAYNRPALLLEEEW